MPIRNFQPEDVEKVVELHNRVFRNRKQTGPDALLRYFEMLYLRHDWFGQEDLPSYVFDDGGQIVGFLGITPHSWVWKGQPLRLATSSQYMVDPDYSSPVAAIELMRALFNGPQDATITDGANDISLRLWVAMGGSVSYLYNLYWERPFEQPGPGSENPLADLRNMKASMGEFTQGLNGLDLEFSSEELTPELMNSHASEVLGHLDPRPAYPLEETRWILHQTAEKKRFGQLRSIAVRDAQSSKLQGWFSYYPNPGGFARVMQLASLPTADDAIVRYMFEDMADNGAVGATGRMEPVLMEPLSRAGATFNRGFNGGAHFTLMHAHDSSLLADLLMGNGYFSRLEGGGWHNFVEQDD